MSLSRLKKVSVFVLLGFELPNVLPAMSPILLRTIKVKLFHAGFDLANDNLESVVTPGKMTKVRIQVVNYSIEGPNEFMRDYLKFSNFDRLSAFVTYYASEEFDC